MYSYLSMCAGVLLPHNWHTEQQHQTFRKNMYRVFNYLFRSLLGVLHFVVAIFTYNEDSKATRAHDKYIYMHACIVVFSISVEIGMSTTVKIWRREHPSQLESEREIPSECSFDVRNTLMSRKSRLISGEDPDEEGDEEEGDEGREKERVSLVIRSRRSTASAPAVVRTSGVGGQGTRNDQGVVLAELSSSSMKESLRESLLSDDEMNQI